MKNSIYFSQRPDTVIKVTSNNSKTAIYQILDYLTEFGIKKTEEWLTEKGFKK